MSINVKEVENFLADCKKGLKPSELEKNLSNCYLFLLFYDYECYFWYLNKEKVLNLSSFVFFSEEMNGKFFLLHLPTLLKLVKAEELKEVYLNEENNNLHFKSDSGTKFTLYNQINNFYYEKEELLKEEFINLLKKEFRKTFSEIEFYLSKELLASIKKASKFVGNSYFDLFVFGYSKNNYFIMGTNQKDVYIDTNLEEVTLEALKELNFIDPYKVVESQDLNIYKDQFLSLNESFEKEYQDRSTFKALGKLVTYLEVEYFNYLSSSSFKELKKNITLLKKQKEESVIFSFEENNLVIKGELNKFEYPLTLSNGNYEALYSVNSLVNLFSSFNIKKEEVMIGLKEFKQEFKDGNIFNSYLLYLKKDNITVFCTPSKKLK